MLLDPQNACQQLGLCTSFAAEPEIVADLEKFPEVVEVVEGTIAFHFISSDLGILILIWLLFHLH